MNEIADRLQLARRKAGYAGATKAARAFGWNVNTYRSHENSVRGLRRDKLEQYARAFRVSPAWLLTGEGVGPEASFDRPRAIQVAPDDLRKIVALLLRSQGSESQLADDLADIVVECLSTPPLAAVGGDLARSLEVQLELQARRSERLSSR